MVKKKGLILLVLAITTISVLAFGFTYSYYTDSKEVVNKVTAGESVIEITEEFTPPPADTPAGSLITKKVSVTNMEDECYVRMMIAVNDSDLEKCITLNYDTTGAWKKHTDGYWYYTKPLGTNEITVPVLHSVRYNTAFPEGKNITDLEIVCYAESVQTGGYKGSIEPYFKAFKVK